jgi:hypothetical protein
MQHSTNKESHLQQWRQGLRLHDLSSEQSNEAEALRRLIEEYEDQGHGECYLRDPRVAALVENAFLHFDGDRYRLIEWCVMPNHVHVLIETCERHSIPSVVKSWKTFTSREANLLLGRNGIFWMPDQGNRMLNSLDN